MKDYNVVKSLEKSENETFDWLMKIK